MYLYVEYAADDKMCIYCCGVNNYIFHFFFYILVTIHFTNVVLKKNLELFLHDKI